MSETLRYIPSGDAAFIIKAGTDLSPETNRLVRKLLVCAEQEGIPGIIDFIPSYNELMVVYDPVVTGYKKLIERLRSLEAGAEHLVLPEPEITVVPVWYGGEAGPDLWAVAETHGLDTQQVIDMHSAAIYEVYMLGFMPGFCYLGGLNEHIATPRKATPRLNIPAGSVGIAGKQTGIYPLASPGGWQVIGQTPITLFDPQKDPAFLFKPGDRIKFNPISEENFQEISGEVNRGEYTLTRLKPS
jgi:inhibitor of KinA